jgi:hypothetical protein
MAGIDDLLRTLPAPEAEAPEPLEDDGYIEEMAGQMFDALKDGDRESFILALKNALMG